MNRTLIIFAILVSSLAFHGTASAQTFGKGEFQIEILSGRGIQIQYRTGGGQWQNQGTWSEQLGGTYGQGTRVEVSNGRELTRAVDEAAEGTTIWLREGLYNISSSLVIDKSISLIAKSKDFTKTVIESDGDNCLIVGYGQPAFVGIKFRCNSSQGSAAVVIRNEGSPTFAYCAIEAPRSSGVAIRGVDANAIFKHCRISRCLNTGVRISERGRGTFENCEIFDVTSTSGVVFSVGSDSNAVVKRSKIHSGAQYGINIDGGSGTFESVDVYGNKATGVCLRNGSNPTFKNCKIYNNARNKEGNFGGVTVISGARGTFDNCSVYGNKHGYLVVGENSNPRVSSGTVRDNQENGIYVYSNGSGIFDRVTVTSNSIGYRVVSGGNPRVSGGIVSDTKGLAGIAISGRGRGTYENVRIVTNRQRGVDVRNGGMGTFTGCTIEGNQEAGMAVTKVGSANTAGTPGDPVVRNCTFRNNMNGSITVWRGGKGTYGPNVFSGNRFRSGTGNANVPSIDNESRQAGARVI